MKQFFKIMFASALGALVAGGVIFLLVTFTLIGMSAALSSKPDYIPKANTVFKLSLNGGLFETTEETPFSQIFGDELGLSIKDIVKSIRAAKENKNVVGIYLESGPLFAGDPASVDVIRRALVDFKESGKFIVAYGDVYSQSAYYLCSVADKVFLNPQGMLNIYGLVSETEFYRGLMNKIGAEYLVFRVGTYKGSVERYLLDKLSPENREQITSFQQVIWGNITKAIAESRHIPPQAINDFADKGYFMADATRTVEAGLVDELKYKSEVDEYVKELAGQSDSRLKVASLSKMKNIKEPVHTSPDQVAVLYAEGTITTKIISSLPGGSHEINEELVEALIKLQKNDKVKAVVLRVNSRGGNAYVSEQIWKEIVELKKVKPVVVSMGDYAASGGYYISCAASKIFAEPNTITGSIGIFGLFPNFAGVYKKLDVTTDVVKTNKYSDLGDISRPMREDEKAIIQAYIEKGYDVFITRCADGRDKTKEEIDKIGQGRVWTGQQALERGLIDELGGLDEAIPAAAELAGLTDYKVTHVSESKDFFQQFFERQLEDVKVSIVESVIGAEEYTALKKLNALKSNTGMLARIPYEYEIAF
jgi:protease-4